MANRRQLLAALVLFAALCGAGCSHTNDDHLREVRRFRRDLIARLRDTAAFESVLSPAPATLPADAVLVTGHIHRIGDGSEALRFVVGYGAGAPRLRVRLEIHDATGARLAAFSQSARSSDGTGYAAHWNPAYLDDLVDDLAEDTADAIVRWSRGRPLDAAIWEKLLRAGIGKLPRLWAEPPPLPAKPAAVPAVDG